MKKVIALSLIIVLCLSGCVQTGRDTGPESYEEGYDAGYYRGYEEGYDEGYELGLVEADIPEELLEDIGEAIAHIQCARDGIRRTNGCIADCYPEGNIDAAVWTLDSMDEELWTALDALREYIE